MPLTPAQLRDLTAPGMYGDGGGLYLQVQGKSKAWVFRYTFAGRQRYMGLGPCPDVTLGNARERARKARELLRDGIDPLAKRDAERQARLEATAKAMTFRQAAEACIAAHAPGWKNAKHAGQWNNTLEKYTYPILGELGVNAIDTGLVMRVLEPVWNDKPETASRVRGRIEAVLAWAAARGYRDRDAINPARWKGHLDKLLPARAKVRPVKHHAALPYRELPEFMRRLREQQGVAARALEFLILTVARTSEVTGARWSEISSSCGGVESGHARSQPTPNIERHHSQSASGTTAVLGAALSRPTSHRIAGVTTSPQEAIWTIPAARMKAGREHRVPLSHIAIQTLGTVHRMGGDYLFHIGGRNRGISNGAMERVLDRMSVPYTVHGFRSTFRTWAGEQTEFSREVIEACLAHRTGSATELAYSRGDFLDRRRLLMEMWAGYCEGMMDQQDNVVRMR